MAKIFLIGPRRKNYRPWSLDPREVLDSDETLELRILQHWTFHVTINHLTALHNSYHAKLHQPGPWAPVQLQLPLHDSGLQGQSLRQDKRFSFCSFSGGTQILGAGRNPASSALLYLFSVLITKGKTVIRYEYYYKYFALDAFGCVETFWANLSVHL